MFSVVYLTYFYGCYFSIIYTQRFKHLLEIDIDGESEKSHVEDARLERWLGGLSKLD